jgi:hypothetical protein
VFATSSDLERSRIRRNSQRRWTPRALRTFHGKNATVIVNPKMGRIVQMNPRGRGYPLRSDVSANQVKVRLSAREVMFLTDARFLPETLAQKIAASEKTREGDRKIGVTTQLMEEFQSALTDQLAKVGFDGEYKLTNEGRILEDLIDRFFRE